MATIIKMPQLGESVAEGTIGKWLKAPGERVERDEALVEVITDKVNAEIPSPVAGVIGQIVVAEGETVPVGAELVVIEDSDGASVEAPVQVSAGPPAASSEAPAPVAPDREDGQEEQRRASPLVRRLAREHNVELSQIRGSGLGGRVTKSDILAYIESRGAAPTAASEVRAVSAVDHLPSAPTQPSPAPLPTPAVSAGISPDVGPEEELIPLTPMRKAIAEHMVRSVATSPHAWGLVEIDATNLVRLRESLVSQWHAREGFELTFLPFFVKAVVESLREHRVLNARWSDQGVVLKRRIHVGIAVAVQDGLVVPVIRDADQKSVAGLALTIRDVAVRARAGRLSMDDIQGGTFTVNNTGALGSIASSPIINQPQAGIITMEAIVKRPVVLADDAIAIRSMMNACLSFDHRITDGAEALRFLQSVKRRVEAYGPETAIY